MNHYIDGKLYNGPLSGRMAQAFAVSLAGCPYRGTTVCHSCPFEPPIVCNYRCQHPWANMYGKGMIDCEHRYACRCGWDQTERLRSWGLVP